MMRFCYQSLHRLQVEYKLAFLWNMKKARGAETQPRKKRGMRLVRQRVDNLGPYKLL